MTLDGFLDRGWCLFPEDAELGRWIAHALPVARACVADPANRRWLRCGDTWFAGVNVLEVSPAGALADGPPLAGQAVSFIADRLGLSGFSWGPGQVSVCYPGYPRPMNGESEKAFGYRRNRDAAHVDGLHAEGPERRRHLREHHAFLLGIPMVPAGEGASPFVVYEGSHHLFRETFASVYGQLAPHDWGNVDVTQAYQETRRQVFARCRRVEVAARPGQAYLVHRLALHGMAPWRPGAAAGPDGRMIVYFRPETGDPEHWLDAS